MPHYTHTSAPLTNSLNEIHSHSLFTIILPINGSSTRYINSMNS